METVCYRPAAILRMVTRLARFRPSEQIIGTSRYGLKAIVAAMFMLPGGFDLRIWLFGKQGTERQYRTIPDHAFTS